MNVWLRNWKYQSTSNISSVCYSLKWKFKANKTNRNVVFTSPINDAIIEKLAEADVHEIIQTVQELYMDSCSITPCLYSLNMRSVGDENTIERSTEAILSILLSQSENPVMFVIW